MEALVDYRTELKGLPTHKVIQALSLLALPRFRAKQVMRWIYGQDIADFGTMTNLPVDLRDRLASDYKITKLSILRSRESRDGTAKLLVGLEDHGAVETVGIPDGHRLTVCFSTQMGCAMGCTFCATGMGGLVRNLTSAEMVDQVMRVGAFFGKRVSNAVAMGQGEPFVNYEATLEALRTLNCKEGLEIGARHITVSTCGVFSGIERFSREPEQFGLAISLHSAIQEKRERLMPVAGKYPLDGLREACVRYSEKTNRRVTFEYAMISGENDMQEDLLALRGFCRGLLCHVNLIPLNPIEGSAKDRSDESAVLRFYHELNREGVETSIRIERGVDIDAACGQLARKRE